MYSIYTSLRTMTDRDLEDGARAEADSGPRRELIRSEQRRRALEAEAAAVEARRKAEAAAERAKVVAQQDVAERLRQAEIRLAAAREAGKYQTDTRQGELEQRVRELEARGGLHYKGVFQPGTVYDVGDCVTHRGSLWVARSPTMGCVKPGDGETPWQLAVKKGRDARDARPRGDELTKGVDDAR